MDDLIAARSARLSVRIDTVDDLARVRSILREHLAPAMKRSGFRRSTQRLGWKATADSGDEATIWLHFGKVGFLPEIGATFTWEMCKAWGWPFPARLGGYFTDEEIEQANRIQRKIVGRLPPTFAGDFRRNPSVISPGGDTWFRCRTDEDAHAWGCFFAEALPAKFALFLTEPTRDPTHGRTR